MVLEQCYNRFLEEFPENWLPSSSVSEEVLFEKNSQIDAFSEECFIKLSRSIICGEYINIPNFNDTLTTFLEKAAVEYTPLPQTSSPELNKISEKYRDLNYLIYNSLKHYNSFIEISKNKFDTEEEEQYRYGFYKLKKTESTSSDLILFSSIAIPLCVYDYKFPANEDEFQSLLIIKNRLMEYISEGSAERRVVLSILLQKCHFIIRKIKKEPFYCNIESTVELITPTDLIIGPYEVFMTEECHSSAKAEELLLDIKGSRPKLKSFVLLMKYYRQNLQNKSDISKMDFVLKQFNDIYKIKRKSREFTSPSNLIEEYDKFSLNSIYNFIYNCRFSFFTKVCEPKLNQIKKKLNEIELIQAKTGVNNFHPYEKAIEALIRCVEVHIKNDIFDNSLIDHKMEELKRVIGLYEKAYEWSVFHQFFPSQLPFEESLHTNEQGDSLFVPSAYARYVDYSKLKNQLDQFKGTEMYLGFRCDLSKERKEITIIKEGIKTTDKKAIDLIAIFTASITFLFGTVNIFIANNTTSLSQLITNTMGLGVILTLFMCVYLLISPVLIQRISLKQYFTTPRCWIGIAGVVTYFLVTISLLCNS